MTERPPLRVVEGAPDDDSDASAGIVWGDWSEREAGGAVWSLARLLDAAVEDE